MESNSGTWPICKGNETKNKHEKIRKPQRA